MKASRRILTFIASLLAIGLIASAGLAVTRPSATVEEVATSELESPTTCDDEGVPVDETDAPDADAEACEEGDATGEEGDPDPGEEGEQPPAGGDGAGGDDAPDEEAPDDEEPQNDESDGVDPIREAACNEAAGLTPAPEDGEDAPDPATQKPHGLENAIAHVLANCTSNPRAPGLLVALRHLVANEAKRDANGDAKAEAKVKAKSKGKAKAEAASHGGGTPGSGGTPPGNGGSNGNGGGPGRGVSHGTGNPHGGSAPPGNPHGG